MSIGILTVHGALISPFPTFPVALFRRYYTSSVFLEETLLVRIVTSELDSGRWVELFRNVI